jgi:hypothetical protein
VYKGAGGRAGELLTTKLANLGLVYSNSSEAKEIAERNMPERQ